MNHKHLKIMSASLLAVLLLSACGDSNRSSGAASGDAFVNTVRSITNTTPEDTEATNVDAQSVTLPEASEPSNVG